MNLTFQNVAAGDMQQIKAYFSAVMPHITMVVVEELSLGSMMADEACLGQNFVSPLNPHFVYEMRGTVEGKPDKWHIVAVGELAVAAEADEPLSAFKPHLNGAIHPQHKKHLVPYSEGDVVDWAVWDAAKE
jgi:hypothetical protein